jgi:hypothetical protein
MAAEDEGGGDGAGESGEVAVTGGIWRGMVSVHQVMLLSEGGRDQGTQPIHGEEARTLKSKNSRRLRDDRPLWCFGKKGKE